MDKPQYTMKASQYLAQARSAEEWGRQQLENMKAEGWVWNGVCYTHPDKPGQEIHIG